MHFDHLCIFFGETLIAKWFDHFSNGLDFIAKLWFLYSLYKSLVRYLIWQIFLPICGLVFHFLDTIMNVLNFHEIQVYIFPFVACSFGVMFKKSLLYLKSQVFLCLYFLQLSSVQLLSRVRLFATPWTAARQASLSITNSRNPPKPMSIESVMPSNHLIRCRPLLLLPLIFPSKSFIVLAIKCGSLHHSDLTFVCRVR